MRRGDEEAAPWVPKNSTDSSNVGRSDRGGRTYSPMVLRKWWLHPAQVLVTHWARGGANQWPAGAGPGAGGAERPTP